MRQPAIRACSSLATTNIIANNKDGMDEQTPNHNQQQQKV
jgi:hypothetical protein